MIKGASFSLDRTERYRLWRIWRENESQFIMFIGLNPSTADEYYDDPTVSKCMMFAAKWKYAGMYMANLFAYRATDPQALHKKLLTDGIDNTPNDRHLQYMMSQSKLIVVCWGNNGMWGNRYRQIVEMMRDKDLYCFGINQTGMPIHPLYIPKKTKLQLWRGAWGT
jgi:hypothetical protein